MTINPHRWICRLGWHLWFERFTYNPQGFLSTYRASMQQCFCCKAERTVRIDFS